MESLRAWVLLLSGTAVLSALVSALVPPGANRQAFRVLCAVALLYVLVLPLQGKSANRLPFASSLREQTQESAALEERTLDAVTLAAQTTLQTALEDKLRSAGLTEVRAEVRCARFADGIAPATIILRGKADEEAARRVLQPFLTAHTEWTILTEETDVD